MADIINKIKNLYFDSYGKSEILINSLPRSGSDRQYFRIKESSYTIIAAYNPVREENEAFVGFSRHFLKAGLNVPEIFYYFPDDCIYFLQDLGNDNLYLWLENKPVSSGFDQNTKDLYKKILDSLILFQTIGIQGIDLNLCYPHKHFDRQSMMWDLNYFKYMFLKLMAVPFNEKLLEKDFIVLCDYLLQVRQDYFLYRDFQTANVMILDNEAWFIDYQGGRAGAPQYDVASLLYDAKIQMADQDRKELLGYYINNFCSITGEDKNKYLDYYYGFSMIRVMQALGAFGFRGLYEKKPTFTESIVPGVNNLIKISEEGESCIYLPELFKTIRSVPDTPLFRDLLSEINEIKG